MTNDGTTLRAQATEQSARLIDHLKEVEGALRDLQREVAGLPFFVRGFISSEVSRGTGQDLAAWGETITALQRETGETHEALGRAGTAGSVLDADRAMLARTSERLENERPRLEKLLGFMEKAPSRINTVPAGVLPAERRNEVVQAIDHQTRAVRNVLAEMTGLAQSLKALSG